MNKKNSLYAALIMMCVITFSVTLGSCEKNDDQIDDENSLIMNVDTNGVDIAFRPFIDWGSTLADAEKYLKRYYPDYFALDDGKMFYDSLMDRWIMYYECNTMVISFFFDDEKGSSLIMSEYSSYGSDIKRIQDELVRLGFNYKGLVYWDYIPDQLTYLYFSSDEKLEVQVGMNNNEEPDFWVLNFQPTDKDDLDYLIDQSTLSLNINSVNDSCCVTPLMDWGVSFTDVKRFMTQNYPDWELQNNGDLICDTISEDSLEWYAKYCKGDLRQFFSFNNADGERYLSFQFGDYASTDEIPLDRELTRNGLVYMGRDTTYYEEGISNHVYVPLSKDYIAVASAWTAQGGCRTIDVGPYNEEYMNVVKR